MALKQGVAALEVWRWRRTRVGDLAVAMADALVQGRGITEAAIDEYVAARAGELVALNAARAEVAAVRS